MGTVFLFLAILVAMTGSFTASIMRFYNGDKPWTQEEKITLIAKIHRKFGYLVILLGNITIMSGIGHYYHDVLQGDDRAILGTISLITFCVIVIIAETIFRVRNKFALGHIKTPNPQVASSVRTYTPEQVDQDVKAGE